MLARCELCPRVCRVNRTEGETGYCGVGNEIFVAHYGPHFGEEPPISGSRGSGNIFFASCNLRCLYCQNHQISHRVTGTAMSVHELVEVFLALQGGGHHNLNLVSPTPYASFVAEAIACAKGEGLKIPVVYNTHAYEKVETLKMLEGLVDIYLPDFKYWSGDVARRLSSAGDYPESARQAILEMKHQVGDLIVEDGTAKRGLLLRHLVLPSNLAGSRHILEWVRDNLGRQTHVSLMAQYYPLHEARTVPMLARTITEREYAGLTAFLTDEGFENVFIQELGSATLFVPDFEHKEPFEGGRWPGQGA